jgi:hypothetical protein
MKLLTLTERMLLLNLYSNSSLSLDELINKTQIPSIDCFNSLQRLLIKNLIQYDLGRYFIPEDKSAECKQLLQKRELKNLEIEQILKSTLHKENPSIKLQTVSCNLQDLKIIRHYFFEIEKFIERIKTKSKNNDENYYFFWGEQPQNQYLTHLKNQYCK